jgi:hypothetical protein
VRKFLNLQNGGLLVGLVYFLSAFDSTREAIRNSQEKGGCACVQHNDNLAFYCEERLQSLGLLLPSVFRALTQRPHSMRRPVRERRSSEATPQRMRVEERNESVRVCVLCRAHNLSIPNEDPADCSSAAPRTILSRMRYSEWTMVCPSLSHADGQLWAALL